MSPQTLVTPHARSQPRPNTTTPKVQHRSTIRCNLITNALQDRQPAGRLSKRRSEQLQLHQIFNDGSLCTQKPAAMNRYVSTSMAPLSQLLVPSCMGGKGGWGIQQAQSHACSTPAPSRNMVEAWQHPHTVAAHT